MAQKRFPSYWIRGRDSCLRGYIKLGARCWGLPCTHCAHARTVLAAPLRGALNLVDPPNRSLSGSKLMQIETVGTVDDILEVGDERTADVV